MMISYLIIITIAVSIISITEPSPIEANHLPTPLESEVEDKLELTIQRNLDTSVDPCEDFYEFACGNFNNALANRNYSDHYDFFKPMRDREKKIKKLLAKNNLSYPHAPFNILNDFMKSCKRLKVNFGAPRSSDGENESLNFMKEIITKLDGWAVVEGTKWTNRNFDWIQFTEISQTLGTDGYFFLKPSIVLMNHTRRLMISPPQLEFKRIDLLAFPESPKIRAYETYMQSVAQFLGADPNITDSELKQALQFELDLISAISANITSSNIEMTVAQMELTWPAINWIQFFQSFVTYKHLITKNFKVLVQNTNYITNFEELIELIPKRVQANYALWKTIKRLIVYTESPKLFDLQKSYYTIRYPLQKIAGYDCFNFLVNLLPELVLSYYERHYRIDQELSSEINKIILSIKENFIVGLQNLTWLDATTKNKLITNLQSTKFVLGLTETMSLNEQLQKYYDGLEVNDLNFLQNLLAINSFNYRRQIAEAFDPNSTIDPTSVFRRVNPFIHINNAFYDEITHTVFIDMEAMRNLFFDENRPSSTKYGILGFTISHELGHVIENFHDELDEEGLFQNNWSEQSNNYYNLVEECLMDQYLTYTTNNENDKAKIASHLKENIADNIGSKMAYSTYKNYPKLSDPKYLKLNYSQSQLFWLSYANKWCIPEEMDGYSYSKLSHVSLNLRIFGSLSNSVDFAKDFNCALGSRMNPRKKCNFF